MEDLVITRRIYKRTQTVCTVEINQTYINELNRDIASRIVYPEDFVPLTLEEIAQLIYKNEIDFEENEPDSRLIKELDFHVFKKNYNHTYQLSLFQYVRSYINDDLCEYEDIVDEDVDNTIDEVTAPGSESIFVHLND